jgi:hypothetical protein
VQVHWVGGKGSSSILFLERGRHGGSRLAPASDTVEVMPTAVAIGGGSRLGRRLWRRLTGGGGSGGGCRLVGRSGDGHGCCVAASSPSLVVSVGGSDRG